MDDETFERIPWEHLSGSKPARERVQPRTVVYIVAAAITVSGLAVAFFPRGDIPAPTTTIPPAVVTFSATTTSSTTLLSEAALRAVPRAVDEAASWAEWATEAYFTVDGSGASPLANLMPPGTRLPEPASGQRVFVESARTLSVTELGSDFRALVLARLLGAMGTEGYGRLADRALIWTLRWEEDGWLLLDLPEETDPPALRPGPGFVIDAVPEPVLSAASRGGSVIGGGMVGDLWRVVVGVADDAGGSWPVVFWFAPDGSPIAPSTASG